MNGIRTDLLNKTMAMVETLCSDRLCQQTWGRKVKVGFTLVISAVAASISRSSAVRSVKPGSACFACNLSRTLTAERMVKEKEREGIGRSVRTFELSIG